MRVAWLGVVAALAAASVPVVAWACDSGPMPESLGLAIESVTVGGQESTDLSAYDGYDVYISADSDRTLGWSAHSARDSYHASYDR